jgi:DNA polymerase I
MKDLYLIDASGWIYRSYFAIRNMTNSRGESTNALFGFVRSLMKLMKDFHPTHMAAVFDGPRNTIKREAIYAQYKAHRAAMPPDLLHQIAWARQVCGLMGIPLLNIPEVEADDTMGTAAVWAAKTEAKVYLCTSDKDFCQLVNDKIVILNTHKDNEILDATAVEKIHGVPPSRIIDLLAMVGDASDNVPGLPGFGPKTAAELLKNLGSLDYILEHPHEVPGAKKQETLIKEKDLALISRRLVTIDLAVEVPLDAFFYELNPPDKQGLKEFYSELNFNSLLKELEALPSNPSHSEQGVSPTHNGSHELHLLEEYLLVDDESSFENLIHYLEGCKEICLDTETTDLSPLKAELVGVGFCVEPKKAWYIPTNGCLGMERVLAGIKTLVENPNLSFFGHNIKYDYHVLANYGIKIRTIGFDTLLASYVLNSQHRQHSLDVLSLEYFGKVKIETSALIGKGQKQITMREVPIDKVCAYCCEDVDYTCRLKNVLEKQLKERGLEKLFFEMELPLLTVLAEMERHGIFLDVLCLKTMSQEVFKEISALTAEIYKLAGIEFNLNSPLQLKKILFERLAIPYPKKRAKDTSTGEEILELLKDAYPITGKILDYRKLEKLRSTYIDALPEEVNPQTHRVHCTFNQSVAATGRLSCQNPNLQNIPIRTELGSKIREAFRPQNPDWSYLAADYSQIELRLLAHMSGDPDLISAFNHNEDIHAHTAAAIYNIALHEVTKEQRHGAKAVNFGIIYGQQAFGLSQNLNISSADAGQFIDAYFARFKKVKDYIEYCKEEARRTGKAVTMTGRERLIPEIHSKNSLLKSQAERLAVNTPLQGTAADLIKMAMLAIDRLLREQKMQGYMVLQIHDELIFEFPDNELNALRPLVKEAMENVFKLKVPLSVDIAIGKNWKEC